MHVIYIITLVSMTSFGARCQQLYGNYYLPSDGITVGYAVGNAVPWQQFPAYYDRAPQVLLQRPDYPGTGYVAAYVGQSLAYLKKKRA